MDRFAEIRKNILNLAEQNDCISAVIEMGSQTRKTEAADEYSDLDVVIVSSISDEFTRDDTILSEIGDIRISFVEPTFAGGVERRILFDGNLDVDFILLSPQQMISIIDSHFIDGIFARGFKVVYDSMGVSEKLSGIKNENADYEMPLQEEFSNMVNDFWFHAVWSAKKICRGELWTAKMCIDSYMKMYLMKVIELYHLSKYSKSFDVWHNGRMVEKWADRDIVRELELCFSKYEKADIISAHKHTAELFGRLAKECSMYTYPQRAEDYAKEICAQLIGYKK